MPFGKYKNQPIEALINDSNYTKWLIAQSWFVEQYPELKTIIINNFKEPLDTPEHNYLQGKFIDDDYCIKLLRFIRPGYFENTVEFSNEDFQFAENPIGVKIRNKSFERAGIDVCFDYDIYYETTYSIIKNKRIEHGRNHFSSWNPISIEIKPTVSDDYPNVLRQMKTTGSNVLFLSEYTGFGISRENFIKLFRNEKKVVIFENQIK